MANIIDISYFNDVIEVPNSNQAEITADLNASITKFEQEVLIQLLGYALYKELKTSGFVNGDASKWDKLVNGEEFSFTYNGVTVNTKWEGLRGFEKKSLIAYYVYFKHRSRHKSYEAGGRVEVTVKTENSVPASLYARLVEIWNDFIDMYGNVCHGYSTNLDSYYPVDAAPTAYNYLLAKKADFTNWIYTDQGGKLNIMGL